MSEFVTHEDNYAYYRPLHRKRCLCVKSLSDTA